MKYYYEIRVNGEFYRRSAPNIIHNIFNTAFGTEFFNLQEANPTKKVEMIKINEEVVCA